VRTINVSSKREGKIKLDQVTSGNILSGLVEVGSNNKQSSFKQVDGKYIAGRKQPQR